MGVCLNVNNILVYLGEFHIGIYSKKTNTASTNLYFFC